MVNIDLSKHNIKLTVILFGHKCNFLMIKNTAPNLGCSYVLALPNIVVSVINIYSTASSSQFSFNLTNFRNPPTAQPTGNFIFQTYNATDSTAALID